VGPTHHWLTILPSLAIPASPHLVLPAFPGIFAAATLLKGLQSRKAKEVQDDPNYMAQVFGFYWGPELL